MRAASESCQPFSHPFGIPQRGEPLEQSDEAFTFAPVGLAARVPQILAASLWAVVRDSSLANRKHEVSKW